MSAQEAAAVMKLQRIRFYDHTPSPITAIAFAPLPLPPAHTLQTAGQAQAAGLKGKGRDGHSAEELGVLVVAKQNGEIDIWEYVEPERSENGEESRGGWVLEKVCSTVPFAADTDRTRCTDVSNRFDTPFNLINCTRPPRPAQLSPHTIIHRTQDCRFETLHRREQERRPRRTMLELWQDFGEFFPPRGGLQALCRLSSPKRRLTHRSKHTH